MSKKQKTLSEDRRQFWQMVIETWQTSGLSVSRFCKAEGLSEGSFYNWRKKLSASNSKHGKNNSSGSSAFVEVSMPKNNPAALELVLSTGSILRIGPGADNKTLISVISVLREAGLC
jgi:hypothetical protein